MPIFVSPTADRWSFDQGVPAHALAERRFWRHYGAQPRGRTLIREDGTWSVVDTPTVSRLAAADYIVNAAGERVRGVLLGGHVHTITPAVAAELTAAGYGAYIS